MVRSGRGGSYKLISSDAEFQADDYKPPKKLVNRTKWNVLYVLSLCAVAVVGLTVGFFCTTLLYRRGNSRFGQAIESSATCKEPTLRREWRSFDRSEKENYIQAVICLKTIPSQLNLNQTLYDDFPWIHKHFGEYCMPIHKIFAVVGSCRMLTRFLESFEAHDAAPFLAWHRYFIHIYEQTLRNQCQYTGHLAYEAYGIPLAIRYLN